MATAVSVRCVHCVAVLVIMHPVAYYTFRFVLVKV